MREKEGNEGRWVSGLCPQAPTPCSELTPRSLSPLPCLLLPACHSSESFSCLGLPQNIHCSLACSALSLLAS